MKRPQHICNNCIHFGITTCCEKATCGEGNWDTDEHERYQSVEDFLWETIPENSCDDYLNNNEWIEETTIRKKIDEEWTTETPNVNGFYWVYNGEHRQVVVITDGYMYLTENKHSPCFSLETLGYWNSKEPLWWFPCTPPNISVTKQ